MHDDEAPPTAWRQITCAERNDLCRAGIDNWIVLASLTDLSGTYGTPTILTDWGSRADETPRLRDRRWPSPDGGPDAKPCEHYVPVPTEEVPA